MLPGLDRYDADPVQPLTQAGEGLDDLDCDLPDLNDLSDLDHDLSDLNDLDYIVLTDAGLHSSGSYPEKRKKKTWITVGTRLSIRCSSISACAF